jgi:uncharacterized protein (DUF1501 family)
MTSRRWLLKSSALSLAGVGLAPTSFARVGVRSAGSPVRTLVVVFQRGGADGLNIVVPHRDCAYYRLRPTLAIPRPGSGADAALDLDGFFGLHPALRPLKPWFDERRLAVVPAAGSPHPTRAHFDAQDRMELEGAGDWARTAGLPRLPTPAHYPDSELGRGLARIAQLIRLEACPSVVTVDSPGWDTHRDQAAALTRRLTGLAQSLVAFDRDLGSRMDGVALVTMSEFGRAVRENESGGTDHGHGGAMLCLGGALRGGKVHGEWPGLDEAQLYPGRDLAVTTEFGDVLAVSAARHEAVRLSQRACTIVS